MSEDKKPAAKKTTAKKTTTAKYYLKNPLEVRNLLEFLVNEADK